MTVSRARRAACAALLAFASASLPRLAAAEDVATAREAARALATEALTKMDAGKHRDALALLLAAETKFHAPTHRLYLAQCHAALGELEVAAEDYQRLVDEPLPNYAPDAFREAQRLGRAELSALLPKLARVTLRIENAPGELSVTIDDRPVTSPIPSRLFVEPGAHTVKVTAGAATRSVSVEAAAGGETVAEVRFDPATDPIVPPKAPPTGHPYVIPGGILVAFGGVGLVAGATTGAFSLIKVDSLRDRCPTERNCDPADEELADEARVLGDASTASLVIGSAATVVGVVLLALPAPSNASPTAAPSATIVPMIGLGFFGLRGTF